MPGIPDLSVFLRHGGDIRLLPAVKFVFFHVTSSDFIICFLLLPQPNKFKPLRHYVSASRSFNKVFLLVTVTLRTA